PPFRGYAAIRIDAAHGAADGHTNAIVVIPGIIGVHLVGTETFVFGCVVGRGSRLALARLGALIGLITLARLVAWIGLAALRRLIGLIGLVALARLVGDLGALGRPTVTRLGRSLSRYLIKRLQHFRRWSLIRRKIFGSVNHLLRLSRT